MNGESDKTSTNKYEKNLFLANFIHVLHILIILFVLTAPFVNIPSLLILHIVFSISLITHWYYNNNQCSLSIIEANLRGLDRTDSFSHKIIAPIYDISKTEWITFCYIITIVLMCVSIYQLYNNVKFKECWQCFYEIGDEFYEMTFYKRMVYTATCFKPLFII